MGSGNQPHGGGETGHPFRQRGEGMGEASGGDCVLFSDGAATGSSAWKLKRDVSSLYLKRKRIINHKISWNLFVFFFNSF